MRSAARRVARASWAGVQEVASLWTLARRRATDELIFTAVKEGTARAAKAVLESGKYLRPPKKEKGRKLKGSAAKAVPSRRRRKVQAASGKAGDNAQFFLTEFDDGGSGPGRGSSSGGEGYDDYSSSEAGTARGDGGSDSGTVAAVIFSGTTLLLTPLCSCCCLHCAPCRGLPPQSDARLGAVHQQGARLRGGPDRLRTGCTAPQQTPEARQGV